MRRRLASLSLIAAGLGLSLTACASLPTAGPVHEGKSDVKVGGTLYQQAELPTKGSLPEHLIRDFQQACAAGTYDDYAVARQYLTPEARKRWKPSQRVTVLSQKNGLSLTTGAESNVIRGTGTAVLQLDSYGINQLGEATQQVSYTLEQVAGEWRISDLPDGIYLSESAFQTSYALRSLYFYSPDKRELVADPRWIARSQAAKQLVRDVLSGPSESLSGAVYNAYTLKNLPAGLVEVTGKNLQVKIPTNFIFSQETATMLFKQLERTLDFGSGIESIQISQGNHQFDTPTPTSATSLKEYVPRSIGVQNGHIWEGTISGADPQIIISALSGGEWSWPIIPAEGNEPIAALFTPLGEENSQLRLVKRTGESRTLATDPALLAPQIDKWGWIWDASALNVRTLFVINSDAVRYSLELPALINGQLVSMSLSPDGMRVLLVMKQAEQYNTVLLTVIRDERGRPVALRHPQQIVTPLNPYSSAWINSSQVAVLCDEEKPTVTLYTLNSYPKTVEAPKDALRLLPTPPRELLQTVNKDNMVYTRIGYAWRPGLQFTPYQTYSGN